MRHSAPMSLCGSYRAIICIDSRFGTGLEESIMPHFLLCPLQKTVCDISIDTGHIVSDNRTPKIGML